MATTLESASCDLSTASSPVTIFPSRLWSGDKMQTTRHCMKRQHGQMWCQPRQLAAGSLWVMGPLGYSMNSSQTPHMRRSVSLAHLQGGCLHLCWGHTQSRGALDSFSSLHLLSCSWLILFFVSELTCALGVHTPAQGSSLLLTCVF